MSPRLPVVFVSHGAPDALLNASDTVACWQALGRNLPEPKAILMVSAHWEARVPTLSLSGAPQTIHDFSGFAPELYRMHYPAPGAPGLAERTAALLSAQGIAADLHPNRGLDHGAWVPLSAMYPRAHLPVTQLSLTHKDAAEHHALGKALAPLRDEEVLIIASGAITHNFDWLNLAAGSDSPPLPQAQAFADWVGAQIAMPNVQALLDYRSNASGRQAHPSAEHFLPLIVALGAGGDNAAERFQPRYTYGGLSMDAYLWRH